jgi:hypothetical protein
MTVGSGRSRGKGSPKSECRQAPRLGKKKPVNETPADQTATIPRLPIADYHLRCVYILPITNTNPHFLSAISHQFVDAMRIGNRGDVNRPSLKLERWGKWQGDEGRTVRDLVSPTDHSSHSPTQIDNILSLSVLHVNISTVYVKKPDTLLTLAEGKAVVKLLTPIWERAMRSHDIDGKTPTLNIKVLCGAHGYLRVFWCKTLDRPVTMMARKATKNGEEERWFG